MRSCLHVPDKGKPLRCRDDMLGQEAHCDCHEMSMLMARLPIRKTVHGVHHNPWITPTSRFTHFCVIFLQSAGHSLSHA